MSDFAVAAILLLGPAADRSLPPAGLMTVNGRTLLSRVIDLFVNLDEVERVVIVAPPEYVPEATLEVEQMRSRKQVVVCPGAETRQSSVQAGLAAIRSADYVLVHEVARPMVSAALARSVLAAAVELGAAIPCLLSEDVVHFVTGGMLAGRVASKIVLAQTPQGFKSDLLKRAHFEAAEAGLRGDDADVVAATGHPVAVVEGEAANIMVSTRLDFELVEALIHQRETNGAG